MTFVSAASTLGDTWNGRPAGNIESFASLPKAEGMRFSPPALASSGLPKGRVLLVVEDAVLAFDLQRLLHEAGYHVVGPLSAAAEIQSMIRRGDIDCAILDLDIGDTLMLDVAPDELVEIRCGDQVLTEARMGRAGDKVAVQIARPLRRSHTTLAAFEAAGESRKDA